MENYKLAVVLNKLKAYFENSRYFHQQYFDTSSSLRLSSRSKQIGAIFLEFDTIEENADLPSIGHSRKDM